MLRNYYLIIILVCVFSSCDKTRETDIKSLEKEIKKQFNQHDGDFALVFIDLQSQDRIAINEMHRFHAASTMKTPVMIEAFKQADAGLIELDDSVLVKNEFSSIVDGSPYKMDIVDDSADDLYTHIGKQKTIRVLIYDMITQSSNLATNILINILDAKKITASMRDIGADSIEILRGVEDIKAYRLGLNNTTTARDLAIVFEQIAMKKIVTEESSKEIISILSDQKHNDVIPLLLPETVIVANKTGWITGLQHDSAIVFLPNGKQYILVLCGANMTKFKKSKRMMAEISKLIYNYMVAN